MEQNCYRIKHIRNTFIDFNKEDMDESKLVTVVKLDIHF